MFEWFTGLSYASCAIGQQVWNFGIIMNLPSHVHEHSLIFRAEIHYGGERWWASLDFFITAVARHSARQQGVCRHDATSSAMSTKNITCGEVGIILARDESRIALVACRSLRWLTFRFCGSVSHCVKRSARFFRQIVRCRAG